MKTGYAKIKLCIWWNFGVPEIRNVYALITPLGNNKYSIEVNNDTGYMKDSHARFALKERYFYSD